MYRKIGKRLFDLLLSTGLLIALSPILLITCVVLSWQNKGKIFFFQERPGKDAQPFFIIKFKSMTDAKDAQGNLLPDNQRITLFIAVNNSFDAIEVEFPSEEIIASFTTK